MGRYAGDVALADFDARKDLPRLESWLRSPHVVQWWGDQGAYLRTLSQRPRDTHALITADGRPVGYLCWQRPPRAELEAADLADLPDDLVDIDILIGEPDLVGCGVGPRALGLLLARLRGAGVALAGLGTASANRAAIRAYEKAGFRFFRDFEEAPAGACKYLVARLGPAAQGSRGGS